MDRWWRGALGGPKAGPASNSHRDGEKSSALRSSWALVRGNECSTPRFGHRKGLYRLDAVEMWRSDEEWLLQAKIPLGETKIVQKKGGGRLLTQRWRLWLLGTSRGRYGWSDDEKSRCGKLRSTQGRGLDVDPIEGLMKGKTPVGSRCAKLRRSSLWSRRR